jgi:hypothetical protein
MVTRTRHKVTYTYIAYLFRLYIKVHYEADRMTYV